MTGTDTCGAGLDLHLPNGVDAMYLARALEALKAYDSRDGGKNFVAHPTVNRIMGELVAHLRGSDIPRVPHLDDLWRPLPESEAKRRATVALEGPTGRSDTDVARLVAAACHPHPLSPPQSAHLLAWLREMQSRLDAAEMPTPEDDDARADALDAARDAILRDDLRAVERRDIVTGPWHRPEAWP